MVTGVDLVRWQIRIARGERLDLDPARAADAARPRHRVPHLRRGSGQQLPAVARPDPAAARAVGTRHPRRQRRDRRPRRADLLRPDDLEARRVGRGSAAARSRACAARSASTSSPASRRRCRSSLAARAAGVRERRVSHDLSRRGARRRATAGRSSSRSPAHRGDRRDRRGAAARHGDVAAARRVAAPAPPGASGAATPVAPLASTQARARRRCDVTMQYEVEDRRPTRARSSCHATGDGFTVTVDGRTPPGRRGAHRRAHAVADSVTDAAACVGATLSDRRRRCPRPVHGRTSAAMPVAVTL